MDDIYQLYPSRAIQVYFFAAFCVIATVILTVEQGLWSLQAFLVPANSNQSVARAPDHHSSSLSNYEYEILLTVALWASVPMVFVSGVLLDNIGMPLWSLIVSVLSVCGACLRASAFTFTGHHSLRMICAAIGHSIVFSCVLAFMNIRTYTDLQYFQPKHRAIVIAIHLVFVRVGSVLSFIIIPRAGHEYGVSITLWILAVLTLLPLTCCTGIFVISKVSKNFKDIEQTIRQSNSGITGIDLCGELSITNVLRTYKREFWFVMTSASITRAIQESVVSNAMKIMTIYYSTTISKASKITAASFLSEMIATVLTGLLAKITNFKLIIAVFGVTAMLLCESLFVFLPHGSPYIFVGFTVSHGISITSLMPLIGDFVPNAYLGFAVALTVMLGSILSGLSPLLFSLIFKFGHSSTENVKWRESLLVVFALGLVSFASILLLLNLRVRGSGSVFHCCNKVKDDEDLFLIDGQKG